MTQNLPLQFTCRPRAAPQPSPPPPPLPPPPKASTNITLLSILWVE